MTPILFSKGATDFSTNGLGRLSDCISCTVTEERNGIYEVEFTYPITGAHYSEIEEGCVIACTHDDKHDVQPFDIYARSVPIDGIVTFNARHISYRLCNVILRPFSASTCALALANMRANAYNDCPFTFWTDKNVTANFKVEEPKSVRSALGGSQGSILDTFGTGDYEWDNYEVKFHAHRGGDNGVAIRYGVNLSDFTQTKDASEAHTAVVPYWKSSDGLSLVTLPEVFVIADNVPYYTHDRVTWDNELRTTRDGETRVFNEMVFTPVPLDLSSEFTEQPTAEELRTKAQSKLTTSDVLAKVNIEVDFVALWQTDEYADVAALQRVSLCDKVSVYSPKHGVSAVKMQVIKVVYNSLLDRYDEIELGNPKTNMGDLIRSTAIDAVTESGGGYATRTELETAVDHATQLITGGLGGYVLLKPNANGEPEELLIMDTPDTSTAVNVWRFNRNGLGHSHNGYAGPYDDVALTADGKINATMITTGSLNATLIDTGTLNANLITAGQMTADRIKGGTLTLGGYDAYYGKLLILDQSGNVIGRWDEDGITATEGKFSGELDAATGTFKGTLSADCITSGTMSADRINGGSLQVAGDSKWDSTGINIAAGTINLRYDDGAGFSVGRYGDIAIGAKLTDAQLSSFENNKCAFQINNGGQLKIREIVLYSPSSGTSNYTKRGSISAPLNSPDQYISLNSQNGSQRIVIRNAGTTIQGGATINDGATISGGATITGNASTQYGLTVTYGLGITGGITVNPGTAGQAKGIHQTFVTGDGHTVTVTDGIITGYV